MDATLRQFLRLSDAVMIADRNHVIIEVNERYEKITGYSKAEVIGLGAGVLKSAYTPRHVYQSLKSALHNDQAWSGVFINKKKNGELWHSSISITPFIVGGVCRYVGIFRELEQLNEGLRIGRIRSKGRFCRFWLLRARSGIRGSNSILSAFGNLRSNCLLSITGDYAWI